MIVTPHLLLGAAIGAKIKHFGWIIVLAIISHFILDKIPHWDYGKKALEKFTRNKSFKTLFIFFAKMIFDGLIGLTIVVIIILQKNLLNINDIIPIAIGIAASLFPDLDLGVIKLLGRKFKNFSTSYIKFHNKFLHIKKHISKPTFLGVGTQVVVSIIAILILLL